MPCDSPVIIENVKEFTKIPVPCGKCPPCRKRRVDSWVFRMMQEDRMAEASHFVTLTYSTMSVPLSENRYMTLHKPDFQNFMKRLRKQTGYKNIKYYAVGEYGEKNKRPHYHAIIFNCKTAVSYARAWSLKKNNFMDRFKPVNKNGRLYDPFPYLNSDDNVALGTVDVGQVSGDSIAYTVKYMDKQRRRQKHSREDFAKEFSLMSKGLGECYLTDQMVKYHKAHPDQLYVLKRGGHKIAMPKYYREKIWQDEYEKDTLLRLVHDSMVLAKERDQEWCKRNGKDYHRWLAQKVYCRKRKYEMNNSKNRKL